MGTTTAVVTVDEFLKLPETEGERIELIQGEVICMASAGYAHERVKANTNRLLVPWLIQNPIGLVFIETAYRLDEHNAPIPDVSMVANDRLLPGMQGLINGAPDLAIEVVSSETATHLQGKIRLYLKHGSKAVWVVYPEHRMIEIYNANGQMRTLEQDQILEDRDVLPGFSVPVSAIFEGL
jgi:Uma2 family endonuclease